MRVDYICEICGKKGFRYYAKEKVPSHFFCSIPCQNEWQKSREDIVIKNKDPQFRKKVSEVNPFKPRIYVVFTEQERRAGYYIEFKIDSLLRGDAVSRSTAYAQGRQWGWLSVNDIRKLENMSAIPNGDIYMQPLNMGEAGKIQDSGQIKALTDTIYKMIIEK